MQSIPFTRKAGDGGACAVLIGIGEGAFFKEVVGCYERVVVICLPGETPSTDYPHSVHQYVVRGAIDAAEVISHAFAKQGYIVELEATDFYSKHPSPCDPQVRQDFAALFYNILSQRPFTLGDDIIDGIQGAYHIAMAADTLVGAPTPDELPKLSCPVLAVAPGPSLAKHLDAIRALQNKCLIICADTALEGLLRAGITPHIVTPLERVPQVVDESFPRAKYPGVIFAGTPVVHHQIPAKFDRHIFVPGSDVLFLWAGARQDQLFFYGQSTGVLAATLGTRLTTGSVYLVGHDLAFADGASHWDSVHDGVQLGDEVVRFETDGNNGKKVQSQSWWHIFKNELAELARETRRIINVNGHTGDGAAIADTFAAPLPDPATLPDFVMPEWPAENLTRKERFAELLAQLPSDLRSVMVELSRNDLRMKDIDYRAFCTTDNRLMISYISRSAMGQFGMQYQNGADDAQTAADYSDTIRNVYRQLLPMCEQMADASICQEVKS